MKKREIPRKIQQMSIEEKINRLSVIEEAYVLGLIEGIILESKNLPQNYELVKDKQSIESQTPKHQNKSGR